MMDRRRFIKVSTVGLLSLERLSRARWVAAANSRSLERIGVQLYTVRTLLEKDFEGTLEAVAEIGFHEVEFHDYFGRTPQQVRSLLDGLGLAAPAAHFPWPDLRDDLGTVIETSQTIGHQYVILAWQPPEDRSTLAQYKDLAAFCNKAGEACKSAGLQFAYHNHNWEFEPLQDQVPFDLLLNETDPELVEFEMDLFWITKGGRDPSEYFDRYPGRFTLCHVKDMDEHQSWADVGSGRIDFASIFAQREQAGLKYYFVEHDEPADPLGSIESSFDHLETLRF